jgi:hypothetical protein
MLLYTYQSSLLRNPEDHSIEANIMVHDIKHRSLKLITVPFAWTVKIDKDFLLFMIQLKTLSGSEFVQHQL